MDFFGKTSRPLRVGNPKRDTGEFRRLGEHAYNFNINYYWPLLDTNNIFRQTLPVFYVILHNILAGFMNSSWTFWESLANITSWQLYRSVVPSEENYPGGLTIQYKLLLASIRY